MRVACGDLLALNWVLDDLAPLAKVRVDELAHLLLQLVADSKFVIEQDFLEVFDASGELLDPSRRSLQLVCCANVEHDVAVNCRDHLLFRAVFDEELRVPGLGTTVASDVDVIALVCSNETETADVSLVTSAAHTFHSLLVLRLRTFPDAPRDSRLELVRRPDALVPVLQLDGHADTVFNTETAPCGPHTTLDCPQRLCIRMSRLHARLHQRRPDVHQILLLRSKHVYPLPASDFAVKPVLLCDLPNDDEFLGGDLTTGDTGDDGEGAVALDIGEELVVCFLEFVKALVHDMAVEEGREDGCHARLADLATERVRGGATLVHDLLEGLELLDGDYAEEVDAGVLEVRTEVV